MMADRLAPELVVMAEQVTGRGVHGVVAAAAPMAAAEGAAVLRAGGNAYDAAVAAALAEAVLLPPKCGLGGDLIAIVLSAGAPAPEALVAVGGAPAGLADVARDGRWRDVGPTSVGPPAAAAGYAALAARGRLGRARLAARAIGLADDGFPWATVCTRLSEQAASLVAEMHPDGTVYYPEGRPIAPSALTRLPGLARALDEWVARGESMLDGPVGEAIVRAVATRGGVLAVSDLAFATAAWMPCVSADVDGRIVWATPAPTHGPSLLDALTTACDRATSAGSGSIAATDLHAAVLEAIASRRDTLADPSGTSMVSAADAEGNVVVVVHSNSFPRFGSGIIVPEYDLPLANRAGRGFTPREGHPNFPVAGRRPATTLHAWGVSTRADTGDTADTGGTAAAPIRRPLLLGGTPGGANQMPWNAQAIARVLGGEDRPGVLVTSPLWEWLPDDDGLRIEAGFADDERSALEQHSPGRTVGAPRWGCKSAQQVVRVPTGGEVWQAAADPRTVGLALGV